MAKNVADLIDELQLRLRDTSALALTDTIAMRFLSYGVGYAALAFADTLRTFTLTTVRQQCLYNIHNDVSGGAAIVRVVRVAVDGRDLSYTEFGVPGGLPVNWPRVSGDAYESFSMLGKRLLLLYPAVNRASTATLWCRAVPALYTNTVTDTTTEIADDLIPLALTIAETLLLVRERRVDRLREQFQLIQRYLQVPQRVEATRSQRALR